MISRTTTALFLAGFLALLGVRGYSDAVTGWIGSSRSAYLSGKYQTAIRTALSGLDLIFQKQGGAILNSLPAPDGFALIGTNLFFAFSLQSGVLDYSVQAQKVFSNDNALITLAADTSINTIERTLNLLRSYDFLADKGDLKKTVFKGKRTEWTWLTEGPDAYVIPVLTEADDVVQSGLHLKISVASLLNLKTAEREKMIESRVKEILEKINLRTLTALMK